MRRVIRNGLVAAVVVGALVVTAAPATAHDNGDYDPMDASDGYHCHYTFEPGISDVIAAAGSYYLSGSVSFFLAPPVDRECHGPVATF